MHSNDTDGLANSVDPDQTVFFPQNYLSQYLVFLQLLWLITPV